MSFILLVWNFDPYPFILLNLALSTIAAIQAPLIMMSQNRAADYDRLQARSDFNVNIESERNSFYEMRPYGANKIRRIY